MANQTNGRAYAGYNPASWAYYNRVEAEKDKARAGQTAVKDSAESTIATSDDLSEHERDQLGDDNEV